MSNDVHYAPLPVSEDEKDSEKEKYHAFVNLALILAAVTGVELVLVYLPLHPAFILSVLLALSIFKFVGVVAWFMHLIYDKLILTLAFGAGFAIAAGTYTALLFLMEVKRVAPPEIPGM